jgi:hypothetical protein
MLRSIGKFIAFLFVLLFIIGLPLSLLAFDVGRVVFNPPFIKRLVTDEVTNSDLLPVVMEWYSERRAQERVDSGEALVGIDEPDILLLMSYLDRNDWKKIKTEVLTNPILEGWVSVSVDGFYEWIDTSDKYPQITWSMQPFKDHVLSKNSGDITHGEKAITIAFNKLPTCTRAEVDDFEARLAANPGKEVLYNLCNFTGWYGANNFDYGKDQFRQYLEALTDVVNNIPDRFNLTEEVKNLDEKEGVGPEAIKRELRLIRFFMTYAWLVPIILILLIVIFAVRSLREFGRWVGLPLIVGGLIALLPTLVYRPIIHWLLSAGPLSEVPDVIQPEAIRISNRLAAAAFQPMMIQAIIAMVLGIALAIFAFVGKKTRKEEPAPVSLTPMS